MAEYSGVGIEAMFGFKHADGADTLKTVGQPESDIEVWKASGRMTYEGFALGGGWLRQSSGLAAANTSIKGSSWIVSAAYTTDAWGIGAGYFDGHSEDLVNVDGKDEHNKWIVEGKYVLGPGVNFVGALFGFDLDAEGTAAQAATGVGNGTDNDGWGAIAGVKMSF